MTTYLVEWSMYFDADDPVDAAKQAWGALDDATTRNAGASVVTVREEGTTENVNVDMEDVLNGAA